MTTIKFGTTCTILAFMAANNATALDLKKNPKTDKHFFTCGNTTGKVGKSVLENPDKEPVVISCNDIDTETGATVGEPYYMLAIESEVNTVKSWKK